MLVTPKYSVQRIVRLCAWINTLHLWPNEVNVCNLSNEMYTGLLLVNIIKSVDANAQFISLNERVASKKAAIQNLEQAVGYLRRSKYVNISRIPAAEDICNGCSSKIGLLLNEIFRAYVQVPLYENSSKILKWYNGILMQYDENLSDQVLKGESYAPLWPQFQSGVSIFNVLYHFYGKGKLPHVKSFLSESRKQGVDEAFLDPGRMLRYPSNMDEFVENVNYIFNILDILSVHVLWNAYDWVANPDEDFILLQLSCIYDCLNSLQCALPPARGNEPGFTSGPNGQARVEGLSFRDQQINEPKNHKVRKALFLSCDKWLFAGHTMNRSSRFTGYLPRGLLASDCKYSEFDLAASKLARMKIHINPKQPVETSNNQALVVGNRQEESYTLRRKSQVN